MARVEVAMPQMGESIVEGTIVEWIKKVGDTVEVDEDIFTLSTDKVDAEVPAPAAGVIVELRAEVGDTVEVGTVVAVIETDASAAVETADEPAQDPADEAPAKEEPAKKSTSAKKGAPKKEPAKSESTGEGAAPAADVAKKASPASAMTPSKALAEPAGADESAADLRARRSTPVVRKIAADHGITDLSPVEGSGVGGRVTKKDILAFIDAGGATAAAPAEVGGDRVSAPQGWDVAFVKPPRVHVSEGDRVEPMSRMRSSIAENMLQARRGTAHCHTVWEADATRIVQARKKLAPEFDKRGVKLTYTAFFVSAVIDGLREYPLLNSAIDGDSIVYRGSMNIGVAAAIDEGLIVPVLKDADTLNLFGIAKGVNDLGYRARNRQLKPQDVADGTFTVSNAGIWGSLFGIPILVQPQVGILGIGGIKKRVIADEDDNIRVRSLVNMCLTFDHRLIDGATADGFMSFVTKRLAEWE